METWPCKHIKWDSDFKGFVTTEEGTSSCSIQTFENEGGQNFPLTQTMPVDPRWVCCPFCTKMKPR